MPATVVKIHKNSLIDVQVEVKLDAHPDSMNLIYNWLDKRKINFCGHEITER